MRVCVVSESVLAPGHGVETAFRTHVDGLRSAGVDVRANRVGRADLCHAHTLGPLFWAARSRIRPIVLSAHVTPESMEGSLRGYRSWSAPARAYLRRAYSRADHVVAVSDEVRQRLRSLGVRTPITVIPNAVDVRRFAAGAGMRHVVRERYGYAPDDFVVLAVGQLQPRKGTTTFLRLAAEMPRLRFLWVGGRPFGPLTARPESAARAIPPNVRLAGTVSFESMPATYAAADVLCLPTHHETFGLVAIEAAAAGLPVVLRDLPVFRQLFGDAHVACAEDEFAAVLDRLAGDPAFRALRQERARGLAASFGLPRMIDRHIELYRSLLS